MSATLEDRSKFGDILLSQAVKWDNLVEEMHQAYLKEAKAHLETKSFLKNSQAFMNRMHEQIIGHQAEIRRLREEIKRLKELHDQGTLHRDPRSFD